MALHVYLHSPVTVFAARVNMAGVITYPITSIAFDGVTTGAFGDIVADMTLLLGSAAGLDDYGRVRVQNVASSTEIPIPRTSQGIEDGELTIVDNAHVTILADFRVWAKHPYIAADGEMFKDTNVALGTFGSEQPPVANCGPGFAGDINSGTSVITVTFPPTGVTSFAVADGATIDTYAWDVGPGTITVGTSASAEITATFPAGFCYVALTVTDTNGRSHTARCPVYARNPASDTTLQEYGIERHHIGQDGQELTLRVYEDLPRATYPDGLLVMFWDGEPLSSGDRSNIQFIGWHQLDEAESRGTRTGTIRGTVLHCVDVGGRLRSLPGFPQSLERAASPVDWSQMVNPNMDKYLHYLLQWHSTALSLADYSSSGTGDDYVFVLFESAGESLYDQVHNHARRMVPAHLLTVNRKGQIAVTVDPMLQDINLRTAGVQTSLLESEIENIRLGFARPPRVHWLRRHALLTTTDYVDVGGTPTLPTLHAIAPGDAPGQGLNEVTTSEGLAQSQLALNRAAGHEYARLNARYGPIIVDMADDSAYLDVDPADLDWVSLQLTADNAAQRGFTFTAARAQCKAIDFRYQSTRTGVVRRVQFTLELETVGKPATTVIPEGSEYVPDESFVPPLPGDPEYYYGDINAYILWNNTRVFRTWNLQAASPVWEFVDTGITGDIYDGVYVQYADDTVGMWLMTSTAIWWCNDIMATTPAWDDVLPIATVQAADATPTTGVVEFKCMAEYATQPGFLIVATGPVANDISYPHAFFWRTTNYGANWTQIDMDDFLKQSPFRTPPTGNRGYCHASRFNMGIYRSAPTIWCVRNVPTDATDDWQAVFKSTDEGDTWSRVYEFPDQANNFGPGAFLIPYPDIDDPTYVVRGGTGASSRLPLWKSTDAWATAAALTIPTGYDGFGSRWRVNSRTFDPLHVIGWMRHNATAHYHLMESFDAGATWSLVYNSGETESGGDSRYHTPNGWPADSDQWVLVRAVDNSGDTDNVVLLTLDNFATAPVDKGGNLNTLLSGDNWSSGLNSGFALPRAGVNT